MRIFGRFERVHQRLDGLERQLAAMEAAAGEAFADLSAAQSDSADRSASLGLVLTSGLNELRGALDALRHDLGAAKIDAAARSEAQAQARQMALLAALDQAGADGADRHREALDTLAKAEARGEVGLRAVLDALAQTDAAGADRHRDALEALTQAEAVGDAGHKATLEALDRVEAAGADRHRDALEALARAEALGDARHQATLDTLSAGERRDEDLRRTLVDEIQAVGARAETRGDMALEAMAAMERRLGEMVEALRPEPPPEPKPQPEPAPPPRRAILPGAALPRPATRGESPYFIIGCGRSGTTSLANILARATNGDCLSEPAPVMGVAARLAWEGRLADSCGVLVQGIGPRLAKTLDQGRVYGEKNLTLWPFIPQLRALFRAKFIHVVRDGRDVARSWIDWHNNVYGNFYRECREPGALSSRALKWVASYPAAEDEYDVSRPRPLHGDSWAGLWLDMSRLEMAAWHWSRINQATLDALDLLPAGCWRRLDYTGIDAARLVETARFVGLRGLEPKAVQDALDGKINAVASVAPGRRRFPAWSQWSDADKVAFDAIAFPTMRRLGYAAPDAVRHRPADFASAWRVEPGPAGDLDWLRARLPNAESSARDYGGAAWGEPVAASEWIEAGDRPKTGLAMAGRGALAAIFDIEAAIRRMAEQCGGFLFLAFDESGLDEHRHHRDAATGRYANDVSGAAIGAQLAGLGWTLAESDGRGRMLFRRAEGSP